MAVSSIQPCTLTVRHDGGPYSATVAARGELDLAAAEPLRHLLEQQRLIGHRHVAVDTSAVTFVDATALAVLAETHRQFLDRHATLTLTDTNPRVERLLRITGLDEELFIETSPARIAVSVA